MSRTIEVGVKNSPALLAFREGEVAKEVLVDEPEAVALDRLRECPQESQQLSEDVVGDAGVVPRQHAPEVGVVDLDAAHGLVQGLADVGVLGQVEQRLEPGLLGAGITRLWPGSRRGRPDGEQSPGPWPRRSGRAARRHTSRR